MKRRLLGDTGLEVPPLIFGCAPMMGKIGRRASWRALAHAYERGLTCFDVARSYGYGEAEGILGEFLKGRRDRVIVSTKFGIAARRQPLAVRRILKPAGRFVLSLVPQVRRRARHALGSQFARSQFSPQALQASLEESLRELRTDYIDILFLHDPPVEALRDDALLAALEAMIRSGKVRFCGVATSPAMAREAWVAAGGVLRVLQFPYSPFDRRAERLFRDTPLTGAPALIGHQPFGGESGPARMAAALCNLADDARLAPALVGRLRESPRRLVADICLGLVLGSGLVHGAVCSMFQPRHIDENIATLENPVLDRSEIAEILERLGELPGTVVDPSLS